MECTHTWGKLSPRMFLTFASGPPLTQDRTKVSFRPGSFDNLCTETKLTIREGHYGTSRKEVAPFTTGANALFLVVAPASLLGSGLQHFPGDVSTEAVTR